MNVAGIWLRWRHEAKQSKTVLQAQKAVELEVGKILKACSSTLNKSENVM